MTVAQLCSHFDQCELCLGNTWRSYSKKHLYKVYLRRWIIPRWGEQLLGDIRTIESSCGFEAYPPREVLAQRSAMRCRCYSTTPAGMNSLTEIPFDSCAKVRNVERHPLC